MPIKSKPLPSQDELRRLFEYDPLSGELRWRYRPERTVQWNGKCANQIAGAPTNTGHVQVRLNGQMFLAHRIIWKMMHNEEPVEIDHRDGCGSNNKLENLRAATRSGNCSNTARRTRKALPKGVFRYGKCKRFFAQIRKNKVTYNLGRFNTIQEAHAAYKSAAARLHGEFARMD